jgi:hypothetical protein
LVDFKDDRIPAGLSWDGPQAVEAGDDGARVVSESGSGGGRRSEILDDALKRGKVLGFLPDGLADRGSVEFEEL